MPQLLKLGALEPVLHNRRSHCSKKPVPRIEEQPPLAPTKEKPLQQQRPGTAENKCIKMLKREYKNGLKVNAGKERKQDNIHFRVRSTNPKARARRFHSRIKEVGPFYLFSRSSLAAEMTRRFSDIKT